MELRNDDLQPVTLLANSFSEALQTSRSKTDRIEELLRKISKYTDSNTEQLFNQEPNVDQLAKLDNLDNVRRENLELMMEIQRQDYLSKKWKQVLQQNENILETIKLWISENPDQLEKYTIELENQYNKVESQYKGSIRGLQKDIDVTRDCIEKLLLILKSLERDLATGEQNIDQYNKKKSELVATINVLKSLQ